MYTTNEEDQLEAARLQRRLQGANDGDDVDVDHGNDEFISNKNQIPNVSIDEGAHKYVLLSAILPGGGERQHFVVSQTDAEYHRSVAEPYVEALERRGYKSIRILGGGRIALSHAKKTISIYGYSYGFGLADHSLSKSIVEKDPKYEKYNITWSNEGY